MSLILSGTDGLSDIDGSAATPAIRGTDANTGIFFGADIIGFSEGGVEAARINDAGNMGIGTSTLTSGVRLYVSNATSGAPATTGTTQASGAFRIRSGSNAICDFGVGAGGGTTTWIQAADQTGLNTNYDIAMQPNGGNVGIGTASPASKLDINTGGSTGTTDMITLSGLDSGSAKQTYGVIRMGIENSTASSEQGNLHLQTVESGTVRDRIFMKGGGEIAFFNGGTERARIDTSGRLLVGTTSAPGQTGGVIVADDELFVYNIPTTASSANCHISSGEGNRFYRSTSALKYKQDIRDLEAIDINKFRPVRYKSKCENDDQTKDHIGVIADEVAAEGIEELVTRGINDEIEGFQYERLTVVLLKSIQEQQALITALTARITALETQTADNPPQGETP
jgi:hypothetical protein